VCVFHSSYSKKQPGFVVAVTTAGKDGESLVIFTNRKYTVICVAVLAVSAIFISCPSQAATLSGFFGSAYLGNSGTGHYDNTGTGGSLEGDVEYAVFDKVTYDALFTGSTVTVNPGELAYVYQVINTGADAVSQNTQLGVNNSAVDIGSATIDGGAGEVSPSSTLLNPGFSAIWGFEPVVNNIPSGGLSSALVLTSTNAPGGATGIDILKDGATIATTMAIVPGNTPIPEPTSLVLLSCGALLLMRRLRA
jgi:hypothetical protein